MLPGDRNALHTGVLVFVSPLFAGFVSYFSRKKQHLPTAVVILFCGDTFFTPRAFLTPLDDMHVVSVYLAEIHGFVSHALAYLVLFTYQHTLYSEIITPLVPRVPSDRTTNVEYFICHPPSNPTPSPPKCQSLATLIKLRITRLCFGLCHFLVLPKPPLFPFSCFFPQHQRICFSSCSYVFHFFPPLHVHDVAVLSQNLLQRMLEKDPGKRIELREAINHPWVTLEGSVVHRGLGESDELSDLEVCVFCRILWQRMRLI